MLSDDQITQIRERLQRLPDLPWYVEHARPGHEDEARVYDRGSWGVCKPTPDNPAYRRPIAEFVAHAPEDIAGLLALVDRLHSERDAYRTNLIDAHGDIEGEVAAREKAEASLARLRTALEPVFQAWKKYGVVAVCPTVLTELEAALASTRPDASPGGEP